MFTAPEEVEVAVLLELPVPTMTTSVADVVVEAVELPVVVALSAVVETTSVLLYVM